MQSWVALSYRIPSEPTRLRLAVWRRLKRAGAVLLHDTFWLLPADAKTRETFEWLAEEIEELGGTALAFDAESFGAAQDETIVAAFRAEAEARYAALGESAAGIRRLAGRRRVTAATVQQARRQLAGLERALRLERRRDYFRAPGRAVVEAAIRAAGDALATRSAGTMRPDQQGAADAVGH